MTKNVLLDLREDELRESLSEYTRKAYRMLPKLSKPRSLDIGCGSGVPTIELARLSDGRITGLDNDQSLLDKLDKKIEEEGFTTRVETLNCSIFDMTFPDESFDVIWAEGSIAVIGFERGLREWRRMLKPMGFLVVHDEIKKFSEKLKLIPRCGYSLLGHFQLSEDVWWTKYFGPLEKRIDELSAKHRGCSEALGILEEKRDEIEMVKKKPRDQSSVFFVMQKL